MRLLLTALALVLISLVGSRVGFRSRRASIAVRLFFSSGSHFVLIGFLLGPHAAGLVTPELIGKLSPFVALGLGWIGLLFGLQFDRGVLRAFRRGEHVAAAGQAVIAWIVLAVGLWGGFVLIGRADAGFPAAAIAAAAAGCVASPTGAVVVFGSTRVRGPMSRLVSLATSLDGAIGIVTLAFLYAFVHAPASPATLELGPARWILVPVLVALLAGWLFLSLSREKPPGDELVLFLLGLALVLAGTSLSIAASTLFTAALAGAFLANLSPMRRRVMTAVATWEKPVHVLFLTLAGTMLSFESWWTAVVLVAYLALRTAGKLLGGMLARPLLPGRPANGRLGAALLSQGGVSIAIAVSALLVLGNRYPESASVPAFFDAVVLGVVAFEVVGPPVMRRVLARAGELEPDPA
ncbi:MAG: hypothetical protein R6X22_12770 [Gemmatimonadota bacterium]